MKLVYIKWIDHGGGRMEGWTTFEEMKDTGVFQAESVGWLIDENKERVVLAPHISNNGKGCGEMYIIKKAIVKRKVLKS